MCGARSLHLEKALERLELQTGVAEFSTFVSLLRRCSKEKALPCGKRLHNQILRHQLDRDVFLSNLLMHMYGRCGCVEDARAVFNKMPDRNRFSWSIIIAAYAQNGHPLKALKLYHEMDTRGGVDSVTYVSVLTACSSIGDLHLGRSIHERIPSRDTQLDVYLGAALMNMYGKCGCLEGASSVFRNMQKKDAVVWNAMIAAYAQNGYPHDALELYREMTREGTSATEVTLVSALDACSDLADIQEGRRIHELIASLGLRLGGTLGNALVNLYGKCGEVDEARGVFNMLQPRTVVSWTSMISAYAQNGLNAKAIELFDEMDMKPNSVTFVATLQACASMANLEQGRRIHSRAVLQKCDTDISVANSLVDMYGKCLDVAQAVRVFQAIREKNVVSWNAMITAYCHNGCHGKAIQLAQYMDLEGVKLNSVTFVGLLGACSGSGKLVQGRSFSKRILQLGLLSDVVVATAMLTMLGRFRRLDEAGEVFTRLEHRNSVTWNALMKAHVENGDCSGALKLLESMLSQIKPDALTFVTALEACSLLGDIRAGRVVHDKVVSLGFESETVVANAIVTMYGKCGFLQEARALLEQTRFKDVVSWNAMLAAYAQFGHHVEVMRLYREMLLNGFKPEEATFLPILEACACSLGSLAGKWIHSHIQLTGLQSNVVDSTLVNMYGKCGNIDLARSVFERMKTKDSITWTSMIASYAQHGHSKEALDLFFRMQVEGALADVVTLGCVIFACGHAGKMEQGWEHFTSMFGDYGAFPTFEQFIVMADLLSRGGRLEEAEDLLSNMPYQPDLISWRSLLSACASLGNVEIGKRAAESIFDLSPGDSAALVLLSNIYSGAGMVDEVEKLKHSCCAIEV